VTTLRRSATQTIRQSWRRETWTKNRRIPRSRPWWDISVDATRRRKIGGRSRRRLMDLQWRLEDRSTWNDVQVLRRPFRVKAIDFPWAPCLKLYHFTV